ncbi:hypothetical protein BGZ76_006055, partial [Entomortierella beljakovae]
MSFGTTYFTPAPIGREMDFGAPIARQGLHQRTCSGGAYAEEMFIVPKLGADPRDFYVEDDKDLASAGPGAKQPRDRMRLNKILNGSEQQQQQQQQQYQSYPYHDNSPTLQSFQHSGSLPVSSFPVSPVASLSPMTPSDGSPVPAGMTAPTLATMSSPMSPITSFPAMSQPNMIFENVMPYSYGISQYQPQAYPYKHAGNARPMDQSVFDSAHSPQAHYSSQSPDPSGSPTVLTSFPQRAMNSLVDHQYAVSDSPPSNFYHGHQMPSPYSVGSHSPISNGPYSSAYGTPETANTFTPTPPTTPHYGFAGADARYAGAVPLYGDNFALQPHNAAARTGRAPAFRARKSPYERNGRVEGANGAAPAPKRFQCGECEKAFPTKGELASHSRCHLKIPAFLCGICGRPFKRRTDYVRHVRNVHEEVGRYGCQLCGVRFGRLD